MSDVGEVASVRPFRTVFSDTDTIVHEAVPDLAALGRRLAARGLVGSGAALALRFGGRMVINRHDRALDTLGTNDFVEVVDYDPVNHIAVVLGPHVPAACTPTCWMVLRHRPDLHAVLLVDQAPEGPGRDALAKPPAHHPESAALDLARAALRGLREDPVVALGSRRLLSAGASLTLAERALMRRVARLDPDRHADDPWAVETGP